MSFVGLRTSRTLIAACGAANSSVALLGAVAVIIIAPMVGGQGEASDASRVANLLRRVTASVVGQENVDRGEDLRTGEWSERSAGRVPASVGAGRYPSLAPRLKPEPAGWEAV